MNTTITRITIRMCKTDVIYRGKFTSGDQIAEKENLILEISNGETSGFGEFYPTSMNPRNDFHGWSNLDEWSLLTGECERLIGKDPRGLRHLIPESWECYDGNGLVDVVEFALYDLVGKMYGIPARAMLGGFGKPFVWGMPVIYTASIEEMVEQAEKRFADYGYRYFKLKPAGNLEHDREVIRKIREHTHPESRFYIDPNYHLEMTPDEVVDYLNELHKAGLEVCEYPIQTDLETYRSIQERTQVRLMIDQGARTLDDVLAIVNAKCCRQINIHANWTSGFNGAIRFARLAALGEIESMIGSTIYLGIGNAACEILSSILPGTCPCEQVTAANYVRNVVVKEEFPTREGKIHLPDGPGLGIEVDLEKLEASTVQKTEIS